MRIGNKNKSEAKEENFIKFLGTAGARFVMIEQLRSSGGIWISSKGTNVLIDPGPGSIVRCATARPRLNPVNLDGIILTHRHLDHAGDINVMIEAMTEGGFKKKGAVFCPPDALDEDPVILRHALKLPKKIQKLKPRHEYKVGEFSFKTSMPHKHPAITYGLKFKINKTTVSLVSDTRYFKQLEGFYQADILIVSVVFLHPHPEVEHLCLSDAEKLIRKLHPKKAVLTHFGMTMLKAKPHIQAELMSKRLGIKVVAAYDGMKLDF